VQNAMAVKQSSSSGKSDLYFPPRLGFMI